MCKVALHGKMSGGREGVSRPREGAAAQRLQNFVAHSEGVTCVKIGPRSGQVLATGSEDGKINLWKVGRPGCLQSIQAAKRPIRCVAFDAEENVAAVGSRSGSIKLLALNAGGRTRCRLTGHRTECTAAAFHPLGNVFGSGGQDTEVKVWDIRTKCCVRTFSEHQDTVTCLAFSPDGKWVASGNNDRTVKLWDLQSGKILHDFVGHRGGITSVKFHPDEFWLATGSQDGTVRYWDLETFRQVGVTPTEHGNAIRQINFLDTSTRLGEPAPHNLVCTSDEGLRVWSLQPCRGISNETIAWGQIADACIARDKYGDQRMIACTLKDRTMVSVWSVDMASLTLEESSSISTGRDTPFGVEEILNDDVLIRAPLPKLRLPDSQDDADTDHQSHSAKSSRSSGRASTCESTEGLYKRLSSRSSRESGTRQQKTADNYNSYNNLDYKRQTDGENSPSSDRKTSARCPDRNRSADDRTLKEDRFQHSETNGKDSHQAANDSSEKRSSCTREGKYAHNYPRESKTNSRQSPRFVTSQSQEQGEQDQDDMAQLIVMEDYTTDEDFEAPRDGLNGKKLLANQNILKGDRMGAKKHQDSDQTKSKDVRESNSKEKEDHVASDGDNAVRGDSSTLSVVSSNEESDKLSGCIKGPKEEKEAGEYTKDLAEPDENSPTSARSVTKREPRLRKPPRSRIRTSEQENAKPNQKANYLSSIEQTQNTDDISTNEQQQRRLVSQWALRDGPLDISYSEFSKGAWSSARKQVESRTVQADTKVYVTADVMKEHIKFRTVMQERLDELERIMEIWQDNDASRALESLEALGNPSIAYDFFRCVNFRNGQSATLDICAAALPVLVSMGDSPFEVHIKSLLATGKFFFDSFAGIILATLEHHRKNRRSSARSNVDISREERIHKCRRCVRGFRMLVASLHKLLESAAMDNMARTKAEATNLHAKLDRFLAEISPATPGISSS